MNTIGAENDLAKIASIAEQLREENFQFRRFLKDELAGPKLDKIVRQLYEEVAGEIDCCACANCCRQCFPLLKPKDLTSLRKIMGLTSEQFKQKYLATDEDGDTVFNAKPCPLLTDSRCTYYDNRPEDCRSYPHLHKKDFAGRTLAVIENFAVCPIVFNVVQRLKAILWHF